MIVCVRTVAVPAPERDRHLEWIAVDALDLPATNTLPVGEKGAARYDGARNRRRPRHPLR